MSPIPLLSIIIPSYNQAEFLEECLLSVLEQSYPKKEIIVIDGGSTDGSVDILKRYNRRLAYWQSRPDQGQADAVNTGWARASGSIFGWLNSDDRLEADALAHVGDQAQNTPDAAILYGDVQEINSQGSRLGIKKMAGYSLESLLLGKNMGQPGVFISRKAYRAVGEVDITLDFALDFEYFLRLWTAFPLGGVHIPSILASSRIWKLAKSIREHDRWAEEYRRVLESYFRRKDLPVGVSSLQRIAFARSVDFRQARLYFSGGDWRNGLAWLARAMWMERSPWGAARMIRVALAAVRERGAHEG